MINYNRLRLLEVGCAEATIDITDVKTFFEIAEVFSDEFPVEIGQHVLVAVVIVETT